MEDDKLLSEIIAIMDGQSYHKAIAALVTVLKDIAKPQGEKGIIMITILLLCSTEVLTTINDIVKSTTTEK